MGEYMAHIQNVLLQETFRYGDVLLRRRCVYRRFVCRRFVEETFCRGDVLSRRRFVEETFYMCALYSPIHTEFKILRGCLFKGCCF
jgi:hypothetical protein